MKGALFVCAEASHEVLVSGRRQPTGQKTNKQKARELNGEAGKVAHTKRVLSSTSRFRRVVGQTVSGINIVLASTLVYLVFSVGNHNHRQPTTNNTGQFLVSSF